MDAISDVLYQVERGVMALVREGDLRKKLRRFWFESLMHVSSVALPEALQRELLLLRAPFSAPQARPVAVWSDEEVQQWLKALLGFYHRLSEQAFRENAGQKM
ncbi:hypothetical protein ROL65_19195 [Cronobacter malonaticus]|uniref:hypothetical protein n=1 Tax=Cronobacter malonaticus TaxID=413503 RepID=UPI002895A546|nr:hypothetical protein [Cronobacter malonaticus]MDT3583148.1 hypothetical protein [Cronobacter malonaticus]